jgi:ABC-type sugar transport system permease subunit
LGTLAIPSQPRVAVHRRVLARFEGERVLGYALLLPAIIYIVALIGYPFGLAIWIALSNQTVGSANAKFVGLDNFAWGTASSSRRCATPSCSRSGPSWSRWCSAPR